MHLPVLPLILCCKGSLGRNMGIITILVRIVFDHEPYLSLVGLHDLFHGRTGRDAMGSLEIDELNHRDGASTGPREGEFSRGIENLFSWAASGDSQQNEGKNGQNSYSKNPHDASIAPRAFLTNKKAHLLKTANGLIE